MCSSVEMKKTRDGPNPVARVAGSGELVNLAQLSGQVQGAAMGRTAYANWSRENYGAGSENVGATDGGFNVPAPAATAYVWSTCSISEREA